MGVSRAEVEKIAILARLKLADDELRRLTGEMDEILAYFSLLAEVDTEGIEPMAHALDIDGVFRDDAVQASLPREAALANAPSHDGQFFRVPAVFGEG